VKDALAVSESGSNGRPLFGGAFSYPPPMTIVRADVYDPLNSELTGSLRDVAY
jgi:hypothetical protein